MALFVYDDIIRKVRKDPLGPQALNSLRRNVLDALDTLLLREHAADGTHNAFEIPRTVGRVVYSAGYTLGSTFNSRLSSVGTTGTGVVNLTAAANAFTSPRIAPLVSPIADGDTKPVVANVVINSSTSITVGLARLTSALGAGNAWAAYDGSFNVALHGDPGSANSALNATKRWARRDPLTSHASDWNAIVKNLAVSRALQLVEHDTSGDHQATEVPRVVGWFDWTGTTYDLTRKVGISSVSAVSTGIVDVTTSFTFSSTATMCVFPEVQPSSNVSLWVANAVPQSTTVARVYLFEYSGGVWNLAHRDFSIVIYGD